MSIKGAIFDADGTLLNSLTKWAHIASEYLGSVGIVSDDIDERVKDLSFSEGVRLIQTEFLPQMSETDIKIGMEKLIEDFYKYEVQLLPGMYDKILELHKSGAKLCIATAGTKELIEAAIKRLGISQYFCGIYSCDEVGKGKDFPDIYEFALKKLGLEKSDVVVFEDAQYAVNTARKAGFNVIIPEIAEPA